MHASRRGGATPPPNSESRPHRRNVEWRDAGLKHVSPLSRASPAGKGIAMGKTLAEKVWDDHVVVKGDRRLARPPLHRPAPRARGDQPAGVRRPAARRPPGAPPRPHDRDRGPQHPDARHRQADRRPDAAASRSRRCASNAEEFGVRLHSLGDKKQGIVHVVGPQLGLTHAGHHRRLRRLATPPPTARSARWRSASAPARSSTCWPPRRCRSSRSRPWRSPSRASCARASRRRTSSSPSSRRSAPAAARATCSNTAAAPSAPSRWRAG